jgi:hypothetical protein
MVFLILDALKIGRVDGRTINKKIADNQWGEVLMFGGSSEGQNSVLRTISRNVLNIRSRYCKTVNIVTL